MKRLLTLLTFIAVAALGTAASARPTTGSAHFRGASFHPPAWSERPSQAEQPRGERAAQEINYVWKSEVRRMGPRHTPRIVYTRVPAE